jgi:hypothetical protein
MMEHTLRSALSKALLISLWAGVVHAHGPDDNQCALLAAEAGELLYDDQYAGITVTYVSSGWCNQNCSGWTLFPGSYMSLLVINFILPTVIFALVIARRWHLDLPAHLLDINSRHSRILLKLLCSFVAVGVVAFLDMVFWIAAIITLAGPMILSGLQEMLLDFKIVRALREIHHHAAFRGLTPGDRLDLLVSLLCGNFAGKSGQTMMQIRTTLSPTPQTAATLEHSKARLIAILAAQANFGFAVGIAALFFLGAFLYNALGINELTVKGINWTPYALWLMVMVIVALLSATLLTGNNPNVVNILLTAQHHPQSRKWYHIVVDYYQNELYPVSMWDRGDSKMNWVRNSQACRTHAWLAQKMDLGWKSWATLGLVAVLLTIFAPFALSPRRLSLTFLCTLREPSGLADWSRPEKEQIRSVVRRLPSCRFLHQVLSIMATCSKVDLLWDMYRRNSCGSVSLVLHRFVREHLSDLRYLQQLLLPDLSLDMGVTGERKVHLLGILCDE